jgi:hypothetical protein
VIHNFVISGLRAESTTQHTNIVTVFVDKDIYNALSSDIQRYASNYIQWRISNTKATVFPINTQTFKAKDIVKLLENIYFDGEQNRTSKLIGTILIGNIPLPVVNHDNFIFPSIYPYVDFEEQQYIYNTQTEFFEYNANPNAQPEIWHGMINFQNDTTAYTQYFNKLRTYANNPSTFVDAKIWYDDFSALKRYFVEWNLQHYANKHIFAEDAAYKRFSTFFLNILQGNRNQDIAGMGAALASGLSSALNAEAEYTDANVTAYNQALINYGNTMNTLFTDSGSALTNADETPTYTLFLENIIPEFLKGYATLFGDIYSQTMRDNIFAGWRWIGNNQIDTHIKKIVTKDDVIFRDVSGTLTPTIKDFNDQLETVLNSKIDQERYSLHIPIPLRYRHIKTSCWLIDCGDEIDDYEFFFFGRRATGIQSFQDLSIYRWTHQNLTTIPSTPYTNNTKSVWWTYNIFSQQVEANRWYNFSNTSAEIEKRNDEKIQWRWKTTCTDSILLGLICIAKSWEPETNNSSCVNIFNGDTVYQWDQEENPLDFAMRLWWWASPINLIPDPNNDTDQILNIPVWFPYYKHAINPIYDIAWAKAVASVKTWLNERGTIGNFGSMIQTADQAGSIEFPRCINNIDMSFPVNGFSFRSKGTVPYANIDFFNAYAITLGYLQNTNSQLITLGRSANPVIASSVTSRRWIYKTIDTKQYHTAPTPDQVNNMNITTRDRPIDNIRKVSFVGLWWQTVELTYPNLYNTPVYTQSGIVLTLQSPTEIAQNIKTYLQSHVDQYNQTLQQQLAARGGYYNTNPGAFNLLAQHNTYATPNRTYNLIPNTIFIDALWENTIQEIANILYYHNLPRQEKRSESTISNDIQQHYDTIDINQKVAHVMQEYLVADNNKGALSNPWYVSNGYEVAYINSDSIHTIDNGVVPTFIKTIQSSQNNLGSKKKPTASQAYDQERIDQDKERRECNYDPLSPVPLVKRPAAVACWAQQLAKKPFGLTIKIPDYQERGSALAGQFSDYANTMSDYGRQRASAVQLEQQNDTTINNLPANQQATMQNIMQYTITDTNLTSWYVDPDLEQEKYIRLLWTRDVWTTQITVSATGDNCLIVPGRSNNLCSNPVVITDNFFTNNIQLPVTLGDTAFTHSTKAWLTTLIFKICRTQNTQACIYKTKQINTLPGAVASMEIQSENTVIRWDRIPVIVNAKDRFNNVLWLGLEEWEITASTGTMFDGNRSWTGMQFTDFRKAQFVYAAPDTTTIPHNTPVTLFVRAYAQNTSTLIAAKDILIKEPVAQISSNNTPVSAINYTLPTTIDGIKYTDTSGVEQINLDNMPKLTISLKDLDGANLTTYIRIQSSNNLVQPSITDTTVALTNTNTQVNQVILKPQSSFFVRDGLLTVYLEPTYRAGNDTVTIDIPWLDPITIPVVINPGQARKVTIDPLPSFSEPDNTINTTVRIYDIWGNRVTQATDIEMGGMGSLTVNGSKLTTISVTNWSSPVTIQTIQPGGISYVYGFVKNVGINAQVPGYARIAIQQDLLPREGLNVMYLNLFGNDRGNQRGYFSDIDASYINDRIQNSPKLLTTTTQLVNPDKIKEVALIVTSSLKVKNLDGQPVSLLSEPWQGLFIDMDGRANIRIGEANTFGLQQVNTLDNVQLNTINQNRIIYIPDTTDSIITSNSVQWNSIQVNGQNIFDLNTLTSAASIILSSQQHQWHPLWNVIYNNRVIGQMIIKRSDTTLLTQAAARTNILDTENIGMHILFAEWSTNGDKGIALTKTFSFFEQDNAYTSVENSNDETIGIGFRAPFKNISNFAAGQTVGESTKWFASMFLINIGDPLVKRISNNKVAANTNFDTSIWQTVYSDPWKTIFKVLPFDFNNDGLDDLLIAHTDGSIKLLKNYGGTDWYKDVQNLLLIADTIKDIYVWDVDNNNYSDIIIWTNNNQLRVYHNNQWMFDVDGKMVCLHVPLGPDSLDGVTQLFVEDMDNDGNIDIVTNDREWSIKIFYGWSTNGGSNYVSSLSYTCDDGWEDRQEGNVKLVKQFGVQLDNTLRILDGSLVHRNGLAMPPEDDQNNPLGATLPDIGGNSVDAALNQLANLYENEQIDTETFQTNMAALMQANGPLNAIQNLDMSSLVQAWWEQLLRHTPNPFSVDPAYETLPSREIAYISLWYLKETDPVSVYKTYEDLNGGILLEDEQVRITVHIQATANTIVTFADEILWPWALGKNPDGSLVWFDGSNLPSNANIIWDTANSKFAYMIDNLSIQAWETISFSYIAQYLWGTPMLIDVKHAKRNGVADNYLDILVSPADACAKFTRTFFNNINSGLWYRSYDEVFANLWDEIADYYDNLQGNMDTTLSDITQAVGDVGNSMNNPIIQDALKQVWNPLSMFQAWFTPPMNLSLDLDLGILDDVLSDVSDALDTALQWLCQWFKIGGWNPCIQPPIPFNMSFLTPGTFNIFGCTLFQDKWLPVFFFPGTVYVMGAPIPMPYGLTQPGTDSFYWAPGGALPSMIRLYVSPTLTAQLWFAICLWPQAATQALPQPIRDLWGNCIVLSLAIPCGSPSPQVWPNEVFTQQIEQSWIDAAAPWTCTQPTIWYTQSITDISGVTTNNNYGSSPFKLTAQDEFVASPTPIIPQWTYGFGTIGIRTDPVFVDSTIPEFQEFVDNIKLKAWGKINLKLLGGMAMGLVKCVIQDWLDRQIKYIINNMSQMTIGIYFPNVDQVFAWLETLNAERLEMLFSQEATIEEISRNASMDVSWLEKVWNWAQNKLIQQWDLANLSAQISNPFELIGRMFEEVNLVNIWTRDVTIAIPFIYAEDVRRYSSYLETWIEANMKIWMEWKNVVKSWLGICSNRTLPENWNAKDEYENARQYVRQRRQQLNTELNQALAANNLDRAQAIRTELNQIQQCDNFTQNAKFQQFLNIERNSAWLIRDIKQNLKVLEQYQQFPLQLYEWIHVTDRYLTELSWFIANFFGTIAYWLGTNAKRFSQYVDAIITLIGVIKTWQILIDLSANWAESCGKCSNDTYDYYSCSLAFLCPQLPILPIPPFKLPNIYLDMSRINIWLQILLPTIKFVPTSVSLPRIPNFPTPPRLSLDIDFSPFTIPDLPILPPPPVLPTLPPLLPQVQLDLPVLPPAPKIPAISPSIQATIRVAEFIGKIMCIIKGKWVGLVAEDGVKSKVEQMTQRSWNVPFFDYFDLTTMFRDPPLQWFDYQIDTFVNLQFNFNGVYDIVNAMANHVNEWVGKLEWAVNKWIDTATDFMNQDIVNDVIDSVQNNIDINVNVFPDDLLNRNTIDIPEVDYMIVQNELIAWIQELETASTSSFHNQQIAQVKAFVQKDHGVVVYLKELEHIHQEVQWVISDKLQEIRELQEQIYHDYDGFLDSIERIQLVADDTKEWNFSTKIIGIDDTSKRIITSAEHPMLSYLNVQEGLAKWYQEALATHDPVSLWLHPSDHQQQQAYFDGVVAAIDTGRKLLAGNIWGSNNNSTIRNIWSQVLLAQQPNTPTVASSATTLLAQWWWSNTTPACTTCGWTPNTAAADLSSYVLWVFVPWNNDQMVNVVMSDQFVQQIWSNYIIHDVNQDNADDIIMRDSQNIYVKYANQNFINNSDKTTFHSRYYVSQVLQTPQQLEIITDNWYLTIMSQGWFLSFTDTLRLKVYDRHREVKNFSMQWQSFDDISLSWMTNDSMGDSVDWYLVQLNHRIDTHHDKYAPLSFISPALIDRVYVLVLPEDTVLDNNDRIILPYGTNSVLINTLLNSQEIVDIMYYDPSEENISITLVELSRKWKYAQVAALHNRSNQNVMVLERSSPWSNQIVAGMQLMDDTIWPQPEIDFIRTATNTIISSGTFHEWYVSTDYKLDIQRTDNVAVAYNWIEDEAGNIIQTYTGDTTSITWLFFTGIINRVITIGAVDYNNNFTRTPITVSIDIPTLTIDAVFTTGANSGSIIASMNTDIDSGIVWFDRMRTTVRQTLTGTQNNTPISAFPVTVGQTVITGAQFDLSDQIWLYTPVGDTFALLNPFNGAIIINPDVVNNYSIVADFVSHVPMIKVIDTVVWQQLFQIYYAPASLYDANSVQILDPSLTTQSLNTTFDSFAGGICIQQNNNCISYISQQWHIYVPTPHQTSLRAEVLFMNDYITYIVKNAQWINLYSVNVVIQPLVGQ